jgi:poly-gamma-glutamate capsule biosynthesis protein CapA/YwtB (metallophosphatase superfamily)
MSRTDSPLPSIDSSTMPPPKPIEESVSGAPPLEADASRQVLLAFVGDILLGEQVGRLLVRNGFDYPYTYVSSILQRADIAAGNLETAVIAERPKPGLKTYEFQSDPAALPALAKAGIDIVNLANNHTMDFGEAGLRETMEHLDQAGIRHVGAGENITAAYDSVSLISGDIRVAFLGFTRVIPTVAWRAGENKVGVAETYNLEKPLQAIVAASEEADLVVVLVHWGIEGEQQPDPVKQVELAHRYIDAGADLVIGSHPHVLQGFEYYKGRWIAYSMGNFIFTKSANPLTYETGILEATCAQSGECKLQLLPHWADTPQPEPMSPEQAQVLFERLSDLSMGASVNSEGEIVPKVPNKSLNNSSTHTMMGETTNTIDGGGANDGQ